jgi:hypothetical protein
MKFKVGDLVCRNNIEYGIVINVYHNTYKVEWLHDNSKTMHISSNRKIKKVS